MNGENFRDGHPHADTIRALEAILLALAVNPYARVVLVNESGDPLTRDEKNDLNQSLGRPLE